MYGDLAADVHDDPLPGHLGELVRVVDVELPAVVVVVGHEVCPVRSFLVQAHWNMVIINYVLHICSFVLFYLHSIIVNLLFMFYVIYFYAFEGIGHHKQDRKSNRSAKLIQAFKILEFKIMLKLKIHFLPFVCSLDLLFN